MPKRVRQRTLGGASDLSDQAYEMPYGSRFLQFFSPSGCPFSLSQDPGSKLLLPNRGTPRGLSCCPGAQRNAGGQPPRHGGLLQGPPHLRLTAWHATFARTCGGSLCTLRSLYPPQWCTFHAPTLHLYNRCVIEAEGDACWRASCRERVILYCSP
jgi:hypothetical protein